MGFILLETGEISVVVVVVVAFGSWEGRKSWEWVSSRKIISEGRKPPGAYEKKKESPWKLPLKLGFAVTSSGSQAGSCGKGLRSLARSDGMYFVPGFAQIAHQEGQSPSVHAQSQPWVFW